MQKCLMLKCQRGISSMWVFFDLEFCVEAVNHIKVSLLESLWWQLKSMKTLFLCRFSRQPQTNACVLSNPCPQHAELLGTDRRFSVVAWLIFTFICLLMKAQLNLWVCGAIRTKTQTKPSPNIRFLFFFFYFRGWFFTCIWRLLHAGDSWRRKTVSIRWIGFKMPLIR